MKYGNTPNSFCCSIPIHGATQHFDVSFKRVPVLHIQSFIPFFYWIDQHFPNSKTNTPLWTLPLKLESTQASYTHTTIIIIMFSLVVAVLLLVFVAFAPLMSDPDVRELFYHRFCKCDWRWQPPENSNLAASSRYVILTISLVFTCRFVSCWATAARHWNRTRRRLRRTRLVVSFYRAFFFCRRRRRRRGETNNNETDADDEQFVLSPEQEQEIQEAYVTAKLDPYSKVSKRNSHICCCYLMASNNENSSFLHSFCNQWYRYCLPMIFNRRVRLKRHK